MSFWAAAAPIIGGALGGMLGGQQQIPPELRRLYNMQSSIAKQLQGFSQSSPMSDPLERAGLASSQAELGDQQRQQREQMYSMLGPTAAASAFGQQSVAGSLASSQVAQRSALSSQHLLNALQARRSALLQSGNVAAQAVGSTGGMRASQPLDLASMFGNLAQQYAMQQTMRRGQVGATTPTVAGGTSPFMMPPRTPQSSGALGGGWMGMGGSGG